MNEKLKIALPKGRLLNQSLEILKKIELIPADFEVKGRKLIFEFEKSILFLVKPWDVPIYVEYGAADLGIVGKDVIEERNRDVYEMLDLKFGRCYLVVAEPAEIRKKDDPQKWWQIRIATKYPRLAENYFLNKGVAVEIIPLAGSVELAPLLGLAERIVDLVETGRTLKENGLIEVERIMESTARLIVNRASLKRTPDKIKNLISSIEEVLK